MVFEHIIQILSTLRGGIEYMLELTEAIASRLHDDELLYIVPLTPFAPKMCVFLFFLSAFFIAMKLQKLRRRCLSFAGAPFAACERCRLSPAHEL